MILPACAVHKLLGTFPLGGGLLTEAGYCTGGGLLIRDWLLYWWWSVD